jgi:hypothetical protein
VTKTKRSILHNKKAISTILATIIIVSVSIVMAIAVAYWAMGIGNSFTKFEKVEFTSIYSDPPSSGNNNFIVYLTLKNSGSAAATISNIYLNSRPFDTAYDNIATQTKINGTYMVDQPLVGQTLAVGQTVIGRIYLPTNATGSSGSPIWSSGSSVEVQIQTAAGRSYSNTVVLP